ncbi:hypothetical protein SAMN05216570_2577 [Dyella sp. OK004]|uniref:hypothetical protein n=1 Tax=Dyella sp. OK004 TaxID=1855292 RepID=UPI0008F32B74|nr:hypothetical protein [Dyella sp. OK004]SFS11857.1 hypothetical protein SAMN05216570_2577 [Dyella sp. OK004]
MRSLLFVVMLASLQSAAATESGHAVEIINGVRGDVVSFAVAPAGSERWVKLDMRRNPLEYGRAMTVDITDASTEQVSDDCLHDLRTVFMDGRVVLTRDFDICSHPIYRLSPRSYYVSIDPRG